MPALKNGWRKDAPPTQVKVALFPPPYSSDIIDPSSVVFDPTNKKIMPGSLRVSSPWIQWFQQEFRGLTAVVAGGGGGGSGDVSSVFGRTGDVVAKAGDYNAAQITDAVSQTASYTNPPWITSLDWSKITGAPTGGYVLPPATATLLGGVKIGANISVAADGTISVQAPGAGGVSSVFGRTGAIIATAGDYTAAEVTNAVSAAGSYADPAWITSLAWSKITGAPAPYVLPPATTTTLGGVKIGANISVTGDGTISVPAGGAPWTSEVPAGTIDGTNTVFTISGSVTSAILLTLNGVTQQPGVNYTLSGQTITYTVAPRTGNWHEVWYGNAAGGGAVSSVFGRSGVVNATAGDYTAAQVTNAVSTAATYADPAWITALAWSKITGAPAAYVLPPATATVLGGVKIGANITVAGDGTISVAAPGSGSGGAPWTSEVPAGAIDGTNTVFTISGTVTSAVLLTLNGVTQQPGTDYTLSGQTITYVIAPATGNWHEVWYGTASATYILPPATASVLGGVKIGANVAVAGDGTISVAALPTAVVPPKGDGTDDSTNLNAAIANLAANGGGALQLVNNGKAYLCNTPVVFPAGVNKVTFEGNGATISRNANMPASQGLFDLQGAKVVTFRNFVVDGAVTTPAGILYSTFNSDPMYAALTLNTSFWLHGGSEDIEFDHVRIQHTGGYAILSDTRTGADNKRILIRCCTFINNRPHLFGTSSGDLNYGSWTGGIFYKGDGSDSSHIFVTTGLTVSECFFERNTGNQIWGHSAGYNKLHSLVTISSNVFLDIGLDCINLSCLIGGTVVNNVGRRIGYICTDDTSASVPKYLPNGNATYIDHSGYTEGISIVNNSCTSVCGGFSSLDGFAFGTCVGNNFRQPQSGEPLYTEDLIAQVPAGVVYGFLCGNTYYSEGGITTQGGAGITITGNTLFGCSDAAIIAIAVRQSKISDNDIQQPGNSTNPPILLGNAGTSPAQRCNSNSITGNRIYWSPANPAAAIVESEGWSGSSIPWTAGELNWIEKNHIFDPNGKAYEASLAPSSSSLRTPTISYVSALAITSGKSTGTQRVLINSAGNVTINGADSGNSLTVSGPSSFGPLVSTGSVGIGNAAPAYPLDVTGDIHCTGSVRTTTIAAGAATLSLNTNAVSRLTIDSSGSVNLNPIDGQNYSQFVFQGAGGGYLDSGSGQLTIAASGPYPISLNNNNKQRIIIDSAGHVTINAPDNASGGALTVGNPGGNSGVICNGFLEGTVSNGVSCNTYWNGSNLVYRAAGPAFWLAATPSQIFLQCAPVGSAGAVSPMTQHFTFAPPNATISNVPLIQAGLPGGASQDAQMTNNSMMFWTNGVGQLIVRVKGSDGVFRQGTIALA